MVVEPGGVKWPLVGDSPDLGNLFIGGLVLRGLDAEKRP
jgi:hypothetical protein